MNLNEKPTIQELAKLFAARKDSLDSHILWVCDAGEVLIDSLSPCTAENEFEQRKPNMRARLKMYRRGQGYVGKKAAAELETAHAATEAARAELVKVQAKAEAIEQAHAEQRKQAATEAHRAAEGLTKAQGERDTAAKAAAEARERAAGLAGQLQAMQEQNAALLAAIKPQGEPKPKKTPPAKA